MLSEGRCISPSHVSSAVETMLLEVWAEWEL